jgi:hypothetical protein
LLILLLLPWQLVNGIEEYKTVILPQGQRMNRTFFIECVILPLAGLCYPVGRKPHERRVVVQFDNAPIHDTEAVQEYLVDCGFSRMNYLAYGPDLAPCNFFLFGAMKEKFSGMHFASVDEPFQGVESFLRGLSADTIQTVYAEWVRRLELCCEIGGEYFE